MSSDNRVYGYRIREQVVRTGNVPPRAALCRAALQVKLCGLAL